MWPIWIIRTVCKDLEGVSNVCMTQQCYAGIIAPGAFCTTGQKVAQSAYLGVQLWLVSRWRPWNAVIIQRALPTVQPAGSQWWRGDCWAGCAGRPWAGQTGRNPARPGVHHGFTEGEAPKYYCTVVEMSRQQPVRLVDHQMALKHKGFGGAVCVCVCESRSDTLSTRGLDLVSKSQCPSLGIWTVTWTRHFPKASASALWAVCLSKQGALQQLWDT